jgi:hypothetical protein
MSMIIVKENSPCVTSIWKDGKRYNYLRVGLGFEHEKY